MAGTEATDTTPTDAGQDGVGSAIRHFPARATAIEALAQSCERFRDICDELAMAEAALAAVDQQDEAVRAERRLEWLGFVRSALKDIDGELRHARIVSIGRTSRPDG